MQNRYHVRLGHRRTTVTLDSTLSEFLALHLGHEPHGEEAHGVVRTWLQARLDARATPRRKHVSQWLLGEAITELVGKRARDQHQAWQARLLAVFQ